MKFLKIVSFLPFLTQIREKFGPHCPSYVVFLAIFAINFHSSICTTTTFCLKGIPHVKYEKKTYQKCMFLYFFCNIRLIWPIKCCPQDHTHFDFFCWSPAFAITNGKRQLPSILLSKRKSLTANFWCQSFIYNSLWTFLYFVE